MKRYIGDMHVVNKTLGTMTSRDANHS